MASRAATLTATGTARTTASHGKLQSSTTPIASVSAESVDDRDDGEQRDKGSERPRQRAKLVEVVDVGGRVVGGGRDVDLPADLAQALYRRVCVNAGREVHEQTAVTIFAVEPPAFSQLVVEAGMLPSRLSQLAGVSKPPVLVIS